MAETIHFLHDCWLSCAADAWRQQVTQRWRSLEVLQSLSKVLAVQRDVRSVLFQQAKTCSCRALFPQQNSFFDMDLLRASEFSKEVKAVVAECSTVLASHNQLCHLLLASSYTCLGHNAWRLRFYSARFFLLLLQDQEFDFLELALYIFHWPETNRQPYLADCLLATMTSELRCSRCRHLANVIHTLHWASFLDRSSWEEPELSHREQSFCLMKSLFDSEMLRASLLRPPGNKLDACGGASQDGPTFDEQLQAEMDDGVCVIQAANMLYGRTCESMQKQSRFCIAQDAQGGAMDFEEDFDSRLAEEMQFIEEQNAVASGELEEAADAPLPSNAAAAPPAPPVEATPAKEEPADDQEDPVLGEEIPESTWNILKKRRLFPGALTSHEDFAKLFQTLADVNEDFQIQPGEPIDNPDTILYVVQRRQQDIETQYPRFSKHMVRMATAAQAIFCLRVSDMSLREDALMLWIIEGVDFLRFHDGDCYMLHPCGAFQRYKGVPPDTSRISDFLLQLEGLFRRLPEDLPREAQQLLQAIDHEWRGAGEDDASFGRRCVRAAVSNVARSDITDVYVRIPHRLKGSVPPDVLERVRKFYRQTFWCNIPAFKCCQAAQALAKRGHNVVRIFIGLSAGGVGQSLYSAHLQAGGNLSSKG
eukprot:s4470_g4.t1